MVTLLLLVIYIAFISLGLPDALLGTAWSLMQVDYTVPVGLAGLVSMVISIHTIISSILSGRILKRFGTGRVTVVSVLMTAMALFGFAFAPSFIWLVILAIPLGLGGGSVDAGLNDYVAKNYQAHHMSWLHCFWGIGAMTGPIISSRLIAQGESWRSGYLTVAIVQLVLVGLLFLTLPLWDKVSQSKRKPTTVAQPQPTDQPHASQQMPRSWFSIAKNIFAPLRIKGVRPVLVVFLFYCGVESTMGLWGSSYLIRVRGFNVVTAASWISLYYGSITLGRFVSGFITMHVTSESLIRGGEIAILVGAILFFLPLPSSFSMLSFILIGLGCAPIFPSMLHETPTRFGDEDAQNIMGFQMAVAYIGASLLPPFFGVIASISSFQLFPAFILVYIGLMLVSSEQLNRLMKLKKSM